MTTLPGNSAELIGGFPSICFPRLVCLALPSFASIPRCISHTQISSWMAASFISTTLLFARSTPMGNPVPNGHPCLKTYTQVTEQAVLTYLGHAFEKEQGGRCGRILQEERKKQCHYIIISKNIRNNNKTFSMSSLAKW